MIFSCSNEINQEKEKYIINAVNDELVNIKLEINEGKTRLINLHDSGDYVKLLGLNIVKTNCGNKITIGKKFINDTAILYLNYVRDLLKGTICEKDKFYQEKRILGKVAYIKQIEGNSGYEKLKTRIEKSTQGKITIPDDRIIF